MHARFNLDPQSTNWMKYLSAGKSIHSANKTIVESDLGKLKNAKGVLEADKIIGSWFPSIQASVFLSHSHKDEDMVIGLAGWLKETFGIESFIDSAVWGYSDKLLRLIDDEYCKNPSEETYVYSKRNRSTSHVHMMLSTALMGMIDQCECIMFVNTPRSFKPDDYFKTQGETESPWIYSEIAMTRMLRQKSPQEHRSQHAFDSVSASLEHLRESRELSVNYPTDLLHLTPLSPADLEDWSKSESGRRRKAMALDSLYSAKKI
ncbi:hypothetical protein [Pseudomonas sp. 22 E 5]|nr:hypothetical protein [Pseudomonas sp. 22 E 5]